jgi:hypothetical protein
MRTVWVITLVALAFAAGAWAQALLPRKFVQPQSGNGAPKPAVSRCVVPLIEMKAPKAVDPRMRIAPRLGSGEPMPQAKILPVCEMSGVFEQGPAKAGTR